MAPPFDGEGRQLSLTIERLEERHRAHVEVREHGPDSVAIRSDAEVAGSDHYNVPAADLIVGPMMAVNLDSDIAVNLQLVIDRLARRGSTVDTASAIRVELNFEEFGRRAIAGRVSYPVRRYRRNAYAIRMPELNGEPGTECLAIVAMDGLLDSAICGRITFVRTH